MGLIEFQMGLMSFHILFQWMAFFIRDGYKPYSLVCIQKSTLNAHTNIHISIWIVEASFEYASPIFEYDQETSEYKQLFIQICTIIFEYNTQSRIQISPSYPNITSWWSSLVSEYYYLKCEWLVVKKKIPTFEYVCQVFKCPIPIQIPFKPYSTYPNETNPLSGCDLAYPDVFPPLISKLAEHSLIYIYIYSNCHIVLWL